MRFIRRTLAILRRLVGRDRAGRELHEELEAFVHMAAEGHTREGVAPEEARRQAVLELGGIDQVKEHVRYGTYGASLDDFGRDVRYAVRMAWRSPGFTLVVVLTLALGIGANTALFSVIDALLLRRLPVRDPQTLVLVEMGLSGHPEPHLSYPGVRALADRRDIFSGVAGFSSWRFNVGPPGAIRHVSGALVTGAYYETLGLTPLAGRLLTGPDDEATAPLVAVISHGYWERAFAARPDVVGHLLQVGGVGVSIVGISPPGFVGANVGEQADVTMTVAGLPRVAPDAASLLQPGQFWLRALGRTADGLSVEQATARLNVMWPGIAESLMAPEWSATRRESVARSTFRLSPGGAGWTSLRSRYTTPLLVLMGATGLVLLIACANVASLMLARASARQREMAVRLAIGAGRVRIARQLLIESTLLATVGAAAGLGLTVGVSRGLLSLLSSGPTTVLLDLAPNWHVLGFTMAAAVLTALGFGIAPALQATTVAPSAVLKADGRMTTGPPSRLLPLLVAGQVALSTVLLIGAGLFVQTLRSLEAVDRGFTSDGVLVANFEATRTSVPRARLDEVRQIPSVIAASVATHTPLSGAMWTDAAVPAGQPLPERRNAAFVGVGPSFFEVLDIPLRAGRAFDERDLPGAPAVAIVNDVYAQQYFPDQNPVGQHLAASVRGKRATLEIVGLAGSTRQDDLRELPRPTVFVAYAQLTGTFPSTLAIRVAEGTQHVRTAIETVLQKAEPNAVIEVRSLDDQIHGRLAQERLLATLASALGLLALALASVGLYGLLSFTVARRRKEIGVRIALGAGRRRVLDIVLRRAGRLVAIGLVVGIGGSLALSRWVEALLFGVAAADIRAIGTAAGLLSCTALAAVSVPAWRASRVDPIEVLRQD